MIVQESDLLLAALDRRLQVDRALPIGSLTALGDDASPPGLRLPPDALHPTSLATAARAVPSTDQTSLAARLPLGRIVDARVLALTEDGQVTAEIERWQVALAWPANGGLLPRAGDDVRLRVLAHEPVLLFQNVDDPPATRDDPSVHWSRDALELARQRPASFGGPRVESGVRRFTAPILEVDASSAAPADAASGTDFIAIDDVVVGHGLSETGVSRPSVDHGLNAALPVVLQGPAWIGQPVELVVRRERADDELDNPVLDHWCGDIGIDLPRLGRVTGHLSLSMQGLRLRLEGDDAAAVAAMTAASADLAAAFGTCSLRVQTLSVGSSIPLPAVPMVPNVAAGNHRGG